MEWLTLSDGSHRCLIYARITTLPHTEDAKHPSPAHRQKLTLRIHLTVSQLKRLF